MLLTAYTVFHVLISLMGIVSGFVVAGGLLARNRLDGLTKIFLWTTVLTSVTGFFFPVDHLTPAHVLGVISLVILAVAIYARYQRHLAGGWRKGYVISAMAALYLNVFVLVVQAFRKIPALTALAPTQTETPFKMVQLFVLVIFIALTITASIRFRDARAPAVGIAG